MAGPSKKKREVKPLEPGSDGYRDKRTKQLDALLRKIKKDGVDGLTENERKLLERFSAELRIEQGV